MHTNVRTHAEQCLHIIGMIEMSMFVNVCIDSRALRCVGSTVLPHFLLTNFDHR